MSRHVFKFKDDVAFLYTSMFGTIYGRFFLQQYLGITGDDEVGVATLSELMETYAHWDAFVTEAKQKYARVYLFTMFETDDVHPRIVQAMRGFDKVIVPFPYLKEILEGHGIPCESLNFWTSSLIRSAPRVVTKTRDPNRLVFLYNGTNDVRKNVTGLTRLFARAYEGTNHLLVVKTNTDVGLTLTRNVKCITGHLSEEKLAALFNMCDYCITCTRGEGVSLLHIEGAYFGKPIISHDQGVFKDLGVTIVPLPAERVPVSLENVPPYLHEVFYGHWWEVDEERALKVLRTLESTCTQPASNVSRLP